MVMVQKKYGSLLLQKLLSVLLSINWNNWEAIEMNGEYLKSTMIFAYLI